MKAAGFLLLLHMDICWGYDVQGSAFAHLSGAWAEMLEHVRLSLHMASVQEQLGCPHSMAVSVQEDVDVAAGFPRSRQFLKAWAQNRAWRNFHHILLLVKAVTEPATRVPEVETQTPLCSAATVTGGDVCFEVAPQKKPCPSPRHKCDRD